MTERAVSTRQSLAARYTALARAVDAMSPARLAFALYALSLLVLLAFGFLDHFRSEFAMFEADEAEYLGLSSDIMNGIWQISPRRTLGFPLLLASTRSVLDHLIFLQVVVTAIFAFSAPAIFFLARRLTNANAPATLAALFFICWPPAIFYGTSLYSETAALPVFLLSLALLPVGSRIAARPGLAVGGTLLAGMVLGVAAHVRPMYLLYVPILLIVLVIEEKRLRDAAIRFAIALAGFGLVVLPWSMYMSTRFDRVVVLTANGGETLSGGLTPVLLKPAGRYTVHSGNRSAWVGPGKWVPIYESGYLSKTEQQLPYAQVDTMLQQRAVAWALAHPADAFWLEVCKLSYMWGIYPIAENGFWQGLLGNVPILLLLAVSIYSLVRQPRDAVQYARLWTLALFVSGVALISWGSWRFRQPADAGLLAFAACVLSARIGIWARARSERDAEPIA